MNKLIEFVKVFLAALGKWASFAYLLRFAILLWLFAPVLCLLNMVSATLTSGILVSEVWEQYLCVSFFLVSAACSALVLARIALIYGPERLDLLTAPDDCRPPALKNLLVNDNGKREFLALLISQLPNLFVFGYLIYFGKNQGVALTQILLGLAIGALLACIFWWNANAWYYNAQASGFSVGSQPVPGAIAWTGAGYYGHVAYVESVSGGMVTVSEMNYNGNWNRVTSRTVSASSFRYIY